MHIDSIFITAAHILDTATVHIPHRYLFYLASMADENLVSCRIWIHRRFDFISGAIEWFQYFGCIPGYQCAIRARRYFARSGKVCPESVGQVGVGYYRRNGSH